MTDVIGWLDEYAWGAFVILRVFLVGALLTVVFGLLLRRKGRGDPLYRPRVRRENAQKAAHVLLPRRKKQPPGPRRRG